VLVIKEHKRKEKMKRRLTKKEFRFVAVPPALARMNLLMKLHLGYVIEKIGFLHFCLKAPIFGPFFKILQLVHARNRPIQQLFVQFLVESNSHQYELREWPPGLGCPYKGHGGHKYPL